MTKDEFCICGLAEDAECETCRTLIHDQYPPRFCLADHHEFRFDAPRHFGDYSPESFPAVADSASNA